MKIKLAAVTLMATTLALTPLAPAHADGWRHCGGGYHGRGGGGLFFGLAAAGGAVLGAAAAVATAPFQLVADIATPLPPPRPVYYGAPAPARYYGYPPAYYPQRQIVVYSYPQPYGYR